MSTASKAKNKHIEAWLSLVERCVRDAEVSSSNLIASTCFFKITMEAVDLYYDFEYGLVVKRLRRRPLTA